jgi:hypothetical protein
VSSDKMFWTSNKPAKSCYKQVNQVGIECKLLHTRCCCVITSVSFIVLCLRFIVLCTYYCIVYVLLYSVVIVV